LPEGASLLVSRPKLGKSWLLLELCIASAAGLLALGNLKPLHGDVLYLALEDNERRLQRRVDKILSPFRGEWPERLRIATEWPRLNQGGLDDLTDWCQTASQPVLIAIDTLAKVRPPQKTGQTFYESDYAAMAGLHKLANERGIAVVAAHHDRKMAADDPFDTVSGTLGLTGAADTIIMIKRTSAGTTFHVRGRDIEDGETAAQFDKATCRWSLLGAASEVHRSNLRSRVIAALKAAGQPLSTKEIMSAAEMENRNAIDLLLRKMVKDDEIERVARGRYALAAETNGKIGQKERLGGEHANFAKENGDLSDLSTGTMTPPNRAEATATITGLEVDEPVEEGMWTV
jgi:RecA-family ATPase